ncbi:hypothetical protein ACFQL1_07215 [Halomicroarcula sp. GCM10025709]
MTVEFLRGNFLDRDLTDVVYVTATPQLHRVANPSEFSLHAVVNLWQDDDNYWWASDGRHCVPPERTTEYAIQTARRFPKKRLIVHYTQPHIPFMNPADETLETDANPYRAYTDGRLDVDPDALRESYYRNVEVALPAVEKLLKTVDGKTVVTADHGHLLGERVWPIPVRMWGHPHGIYVDELVTVPWLVYTNGERREIVADPPVNTVSVDERTVTDRLDALGYRT